MKPLKPAIIVISVICLTGIIYFSYKQTLREQKTPIPEEQTLLQKEKIKIKRSKTILFSDKGGTLEGLEKQENNIYSTPVWQGLYLLVLPGDYAGNDWRKGAYNYYFVLSREKTKIQDKDLLPHDIPSHGPSSDSIYAWHYGSKKKDYMFGNPRILDYDKYEMRLDVKKVELESEERMIPEPAKKTAIIWYFKTFKAEVTVLEKDIP
ncbi:MAG: hypothetical protein WCK36_04030 [Candidatus Firestonebacteria bacterium]